LKSDGFDGFLKVAAGFAVAGGLLIGAALAFGGERESDKKKALRKF